MSAVNPAFSHQADEPDTSRHEPPNTEHLPFVIRVARTEDQLLRAVSVRSQAYMRHRPELGRKLLEPEPFDLQSDSVVLLAETKLDGMAVGSLRIQSNQFTQLPVEAAVSLPEELASKRLVEVTRLGVAYETEGRSVTHALYKALYLYCFATQVDWMVACARRAMDRRYLALQFSDVFAGGAFVPLPYTGNIPHRVLSFEVRSAERRWYEAKNPLYRYIYQTYHPDIQIFSSVASSWDRPRHQQPPQVALRATATLPIKASGH